MYRRDSRVRFRIFGTVEYLVIERSKEYTKTLGSKKQVRKMMSTREHEPLKGE